MLYINTNVNSRSHYDETGSQFTPGMPKMFFRSKDTVAWQLYSATPGLDESQTIGEVWTKFTGYAGMTGINAYLTADSNYTHRLKGKLLSSVSGTVTEISAQINGAGFNTVPDSGTVNLFDNEGHYETVQYISRTIEGSTVTFTMDGTPSVSGSYPADGVMDAGEEVYMQATLDYQQSDVSTGLFVFNITAYSEKLRQAIVYSDVESVPIRGLELAIFQVKDGYKQDVERFVVTTFKIMSGIAETGLDPLLPEQHVNEAALMVETLLASGLAVQFSEDGETWVDAEASESSSSPFPYSYFRFRLAGAGGTWSPAVYLRQGQRGNRITNGTAITGRETLPTPYETGIPDSLIGDMYINVDTQDVYLCVQDGDEDVALWCYSYCLKGEAFDKLDRETIDQNSDSELQAVGLRETNDHRATHIWIGTKAEYEAQHKDDDDDLCIITDEEEALLVDSELSLTSPNLVQNRAVANAVVKKEDIAREVVASSAVLLQVEPGKAYKWSLFSDGAIAFDHSDFASKRVVVPVKVSLGNGAVFTGATAAEAAVTVEGTPASGDWEMIWDGARAVFQRAGAGGDPVVVDSEISNSSSHAVQNRAVAAALALKADKTEIPALITVDSELSDSSSNAIQNKAVKKALDGKLDVELPVVSSTSATLTVEEGKAYDWTPSADATIAFDHTGLTGKRVSIPVYLTLASGRTVSGSSASAAAVTVNGTIESGECELIWNGTAASFQRKGEGASSSGVYLYIAYATDSSGNGWTQTPDASHPYMAVKQSTTPLTPTSSDFSGASWMKYLGDNGTNAYVYVAYATNGSGSGWTLTPDSSHPYMAVKQSSTALTPTSSDFSGATWVKYLGDNGTRGSRINYGTAITGTSTSPASYATGISDSLANDLYVNTDTGNLYQCTTGGNASSAKWVFACALAGQDAISNVKLNGETLTINNRAVDVKSLAISSAMPPTDFSSQTYVLYTGATNTVFKKGHVYMKETSPDESVMEIAFSVNGVAYSVSLSKTPGGWYGDNSSSIWYGDNSSSMVYNSSTHRWILSRSGASWGSPECDETDKPWTLTGQTWIAYSNTTYSTTPTFLRPTGWTDITPTGEIALNGKALTQADGVTDIPALAEETVMPAASADSQDHVVYLGASTADYKKAHVYEKTTEYNDRVINVTWTNGDHTLTKHGSNDFWDDYDGSSYDWSMSYANGHWVLNGSGPYYTSPAASADSWPWDFSGQTWAGPMSGMDIVPTITRAPVYGWEDITPAGKIQLNGEDIEESDSVSDAGAVNVKALALLKSLPEPGATGQDYVFYGGENNSSANPPLIKGHVYFREGSWSDETLTATVNGVSQTLYKVTGYTNKWTDNGQEYADDYGMSWNGTSTGNWTFYSPSGTFDSPVCEYTVMPWELSGQEWTWYGEDTTRPVTVERFFDGSWTDLTAQADSDGTAPLPYATAMPTAEKGAKDFVLFLGTTDASHTKGHLYQNTMSIAASLTVTVNGSAQSLNKVAGVQELRWADGNGDYSLYYSTTRWYYNQDGWLWKSPVCPNTTMPWELNGQAWTDSDDYPMYPTISDPSSYSWTDLGAVLSA